MYLKSIEVQGFKSFANRLVFEFHNGITGIVGPNGSGKSNIGDAVRWVLGEQSAKQLRGGKMEDVIFAGTELRKPVSYASVAITIDNSDHALPVDFDQVTITRKVFRSGESEYLMNGSACRLRDINELFYDTGIGKEGYSIIGQGQIDRILSGKPEERRELFDEAAGIVKFKRRKAAAQKKLDDESRNLVRVNDILAELEKQVGPLEHQAEKAKEYLKLKEELKKNDVNLFLIESDEFKEELAKVNETFSIADAELKAAKAEFEKSGAEYEANEERLSCLNHTIEENSSIANQAEIDKNRLSSQIELLNEQIKSVLASDEQLNKRLDSIKERLLDSDEEKKRLISERFKLTDRLDEMKAECEEADNIVKSLTESIAELEENVENGKDDVIDNLNERGQIKAKLQRNVTLLEQVNIRKSELTRKLINCKSEEDTQKQNLDSLKKQLSDVREDISSINEKLSDREKNQLLIRDTINKYNTDINNLNRIVMGESSRLESLKNITERYDGYGSSIRKVMEQKEKNKGIIGVVADIIKTKKQYETAIETALGGTIQNIVTDNEETAKGLITFLKQNKFGRATFLPLSAISGRDIKVDNTLTSEKGAIGFANQLIECDSEFYELARYLLGRILVVDNIDNALAIARRHNHSVRIVTLEGDMLSPGGSMSGGAFKNSSNLLGRRREIEELETSVAGNEKKLKSLETELSNARDKLSVVRNELEQLKTELQEKQLAENTSLMNLEAAERKQEELNRAYTNSKRESEEIEVSVLQINAEIDACKIALAESERHDKELTDKINSDNAKIEQNKAELAARQAEAEKRHIELANFSQQDTFAEENIKRVLREISRLNEEADEIKDSLGSADDEIREKKENIAKIGETIATAEAKIAEYAGITAKEREERDKVQEKQRELFTRREEISGRINTLDKECLRISSRIEKIETMRDERIDYMWNEYELTLIRAAELRDESLNNSDVLRKSITVLKADIKKLGDVNVNAIEDYKEISERYIFLKTQHDDLITARDTLIKVIDELDTGMRTQFIEKFQEIKVEFDKVFKELFGGGRGTLELEEDVDILEAGIKIISQPPGKKLQNMMQLSGGEKALTAISLLFAIQNLKPSPFCLLDEIEAALDDSNVVRYAKYLHKLTKNTQFIVITHRRGTMAAADRLYGITMQEKGVSTLVSVDLIEDQLDDKREEN
ncbi:chromosome partition protein Smc [Firmicutes bacterium CAG:882]|nr:chromosome partition protein Smc [Firmicutes bacterium CAG:882]